MNRAYPNLYSVRLFNRALGTAHLIPTSDCGFCLVYYHPGVFPSGTYICGFVDELACAAATSGALKHWRDMRCQSPEVARPLLLQRWCQSGGMAAAHAKGRIQRLQYVGDGVPVVPVFEGPSARRRRWRARDRAGEHYGSRPPPWGGGFLEVGGRIHLGTPRPDARGGVTASGFILY